jgi:hypothetical protein
MVSQEPRDEPVTAWVGWLAGMQRVLLCPLAQLVAVAMRSPSRPADALQRQLHRARRVPRALL